MPDTPLKPLTIVSPCFNECEVIGRFIERMLQVADELRDVCDVHLLIVDDGSKDGSQGILEQWRIRDARVSWLGLARNFGHQAALTAGINHAPEGAVLTMDSDLEHPPEMVPVLVRHWLAGTDVVSAVRDEPEGLPWWKSWTSNLFYTVFNFLSDTKLQCGSADFNLLSVKARAGLRQLPEYHRFIRAMISWIGFSRTFVPYKQPVRPAGRSKYTLRRMLRLALQGVFSFSSRPIYWMFSASLALTIGGCLYFVYALWVHFATGQTTAGWTSVIAVLLILGGWQTLVCSLVGLYVAKIFEQVKGRPSYIIETRNGKTGDDSR